MKLVHTFHLSSIFNIDTIDRTDSAISNRLPWQHRCERISCNARDLGSIPGSGRSPGEGNGNPLQIFLPGESHGQRSLAGCSPWCHKELDTAEQLSTHAHISDAAGAMGLIQFSSLYFVVVHSLSHVCLFATPWTVAHQASLPFAITQSLLKLMSVESVMPSNHLILCCPLLLLPSIFPSITVFSNESVLRIRWPIYWSFKISPFNDY